MDAELEKMLGSTPYHEDSPSERLWSHHFQITVDGKCSHENQKCLLLGRKAMTNLDRVIKGRDITLPTKVHLFKAMVFPVVMYRCENWTIKKAEHQRTDAFELWCWRRLSRVPWTARRPILKEINPEYLLEGLLLKLRLQYFGHLMWRTDSLEKTLVLGKTEGRRRRGQQDEMVRWHHWFNLVREQQQFMSTSLSPLTTTLYSLQIVFSFLRWPCCKYI